MMKLVCSSSRFKSKWVLSNFFHSTKTLTFSYSYRDDALYRRISRAGDLRVSIVPILERWVEEGNSVDKDNLNRMVRQLRVYKRYRHALDISQWMSDRRYFFLSPGDIAIRLDLISKVHGLENAEVYFDNTPKQLKGHQVFGALLNCYTHWKSVEKAEAHMQKMKELGFARGSLSYNVMLNLYSKTGQYEKLHTVIEEMKEKGVYQDLFTLSIQLGAYADVTDIAGMEKILQKIEADSKLIGDSPYPYLNASKGYIKAGLIDKALDMLKKTEGFLSGRKRKIAYESLLSMYARIGLKDEVYRIWNMYKSSEKKLYNTAYMSMLSALSKLEDIAGAEKIHQEWESEGNTFDFRIVNTLNAAYCKNGLLEKAETIIKDAIEKGKKPYPSTWHCLAAGYIEAGRLPEAVETMKKAISIGQSYWKPKRDTLVACLDYLKEKGDSKEINEFAKLLGFPGPFSADAYDTLLNYIDGGICESDTVREIDGEDSDDNEDEDTDIIQERRLDSIS